METRDTLKLYKVHSYFDYLLTTFKIAGFWELYPKTDNVLKILTNGVYLAIILFILACTPVTLAVHLYTEWVDILSSLDTLAECLPFLVSLAIVAHYALNRDELYALVEYMNDHFRYRSAAGVTSMSMFRSYCTARKFARIYTACTTFSVTLYAMLPVAGYLLTKEPIQHWLYMDLTRSPFTELMFLRSWLAQLFVGLAIGQFGVFFASNSILICGQLDLICCSLRNARYTALLQHGVHHATLLATHGDIRNDERYNYMYNVAEVEEPMYHYDNKRGINFRTTRYNINSSQYDAATEQALKDCAAMCQVVNTYKERFERFASPLLVLRVVQVTMYLCTLLYAATLKFDMITVEYLAAVALDIFVYCYYGNQIILQADRVTTAAYQSAWHTMGVRPRRVLLNVLVANRRPMVVRAGRFLPMDLRTFVLIIKTSFSYYTLLVNVNENK